MINFFINTSRRKIIFSIIALVIIVCSYIPMMRTYELYVQSEDLFYALVGGVPILLAYYVWRPQKPLFYLLWIVVGVIYFYLHTINFEGKILHASTILTVLGIAVVLTPFIVSNLKKKKPESIKRPDVYLGRTRAYNRIHFRIRRMMLDSEGKAIALYGRWGIGKTHCIQFLSHRLQKEFDRKEFDDNVNRDLASPLNEAFDGSVEICNISLWNYKTVDEAWTAIINKLYYTITGSRVIDVQGFLSRLTKILPKGEFLEALINYIWLPHGNQNDDWSGVISAEIGKERRVLLIFDDIERAPYEIIRNLLPLIERLKAINGLIVLCAIADDELVKVYQEHGVNADSLHGYLSKIFDFPLNLPQPSYHAIREMEAKLIEKKYRDFPLLTAFFEIFELKYDTPRQIERIAEKLSSIELQYLYDATLFNKNARYEQKEFCIFLVEIIRLLCKPILKEINNNGENLLTLSKSLSVIESRKNMYIDPSSNDTKGEEKFKKTYPVTANQISSYPFIETILKHLGHYESTDIQSAIIMDYARRATLSLRECDEIVSLRDNSNEINVKELIMTYFKNDPTCLDSIDLAVHELIDYCAERIHIESHANFVKYIYSTSKSDNIIHLYRTPNFHNRDIDRFVKILNVCLDKQVCKKSAYAAAQYILKCCSIRDLYNCLHGILIAKNVYYSWNGENLDIEDLDIDTPHPYCSLIMLLITEYTFKMLSIVFNGNDTPDVTINEYNHFHLYDSPKISNKFKHFFMEEIRKYLSRLPYTKRNLRQLLTYLLSKGNYEDVYDKTIVYTSEWKMTAFTPWLNECLNKVELDSDIRNMIPEWINNINESIRVQRNDDVGSKCKAGAKALLSILETMQGKRVISK